MAFIFFSLLKRIDTKDENYCVGGGLLNPRPYPGR